MNRDLFLAILAMDSYNRGYGQAVSGLDVPLFDEDGNAITVVRLGEATIRSDSFLLGGTPDNRLDASSGFYAIAYDWNGETIISYRGTDAPSSDFFAFGIGAGQPFALTGGLTDQARLTVEFYRAVAGVDADPFAANITTTGHSLGGGLAGYAAMLYGKQATIFDNMAFENAALRTWEAAALGEVVGLDTVVYGSGEVVETDRSKISAFATTGEFLAANRLRQSTEVTNLDSDWGIFSNPIKLHSMALHVALQFARVLPGEFDAWRVAADPLWNGFFDQSVAESLRNISDRDGKKDLGNVLRSAIAYSAIDEGDDQGKPFGDTGIWAMFDDAGDLGRALEIQTTGILNADVDIDFGLNPISELKDSLAKIFVQYAGALALYDVEQGELSRLSTSRGPVNVRAGVLTLANDENTLALDLSSVLWGEVLRTASDSDRHLQGADQLEAIDRDEALFAFNAQDSAFGPGLLNLLKFELGLGNRPSDELLKAIEDTWEDANGNTLDRFHYLLKASLDGKIRLSERPYDPSSLIGNDAGVDVFLGGAGEEQVQGTSGNDLLILGAGDDTAYSLSGRDLIIGGAGDDTIVNYVTTEIAADEGADGEDTYIGQRLDGDTFAGFLQWITAPKSLDLAQNVETAADEPDFWAEDVVRYSIADPESGALAGKGVELVGLEKTTFGEYNALRASIKDLNTGTISTDILVNIDVIELSERGETLHVTDAMAAMPIVVDLGNVQTGLLASADFDTVSFASRTKGVMTLNGSIRDNGDNPDNQNINSLSVLGELIKTATGATFADIDGDTLTYVASLSDGAALPDWLAFDGTQFTGTPPQDFNGSLAILVSASDGEFTVSDSFTLTIDPVNDAPVLVAAIGDMASPEDTAVTLGIPTGTFADIDGDTLTYAATQLDGSALPEWLAFDGVHFTGTPPQDFNGSFDILVSASDGQFVATDSFRLTIDPVNDAPLILRPLSGIVMEEDGTLSYTLPFDWALDVDGDVLAVTMTQADGSPLPEWLSFTAGKLTGTLPADYNGSLDLLLTAADAEEQVVDALVLTVLPINDAPVIVGPLADRSFSEDSAIAFALDGNAFVDVDGDALTFTAALADGTALPDWLAFNGAEFTGTPTQDFNGSFDILVNASDGTYTASDSFRLTVDPVNDAPVVTGSFSDITIFGREAIDWAVPTGLFSDIDGDTLVLSAAMADGTALPGWISFDGTRFTGTAPDDFDGTEGFSVSASDGEHQVSTGFTVTIIDPNDAPTAADDGVFVGIQAQYLGILASDLLLNDSDPDGDALTITAVTANGAGSVTFDADGNILYSVDSTFTGEDTFTYTVSDGEESSTATVTVRIDSRFADWSQGTDGQDKLFGNNRESSSINAGVGDDMVKGGMVDDWLAGGEGDDHLIGLAGNDHLWGNAGNDQLSGNGGYDTAYYFGTRASYLIRTVGGTVQVVDAAPTVDGDDGTDTISSIELLSFKNGETASIVSPIILDLAGDGIKTLSADESDAKFDLDGDGLADDTSWIGNGDAFLYLDRNGDGTMSGVEEISFIDDVEGAASDLAGLAAFDSNDDGVLSAADERFADFGVWLDGDGDGAVDEGETVGLATVGIASINLTGTAVDGTSQFGEVAIINTGSFRLTNGAVRQFADAALTFFSAATNVPELPVTHYDFNRKSSKYRLSISGGAVSITPKKAREGLDPLAGQLGANTILTFSNRTYGMFAPVVLDLDGDGIELVKRSKARATFDYTGDGVSDDTGWLSGDDGFLVIDRNNDGRITEASELSLASEDEDARSGLQGLARLDSNGDGIVDANDARFGELRIWQDRNGNGQTDAGELRTLEVAGLVSIRIGSATAAENRIKLDRNAIFTTTSFVRSNGTTSTAADVLLAYRPSVARPSRTGSDLLPGRFISPFEFPIKEAPNPRSELLPNRDTIFDMLRENREGLLRRLFDSGSSEDVTAPTSSEEPLDLLSPHVDAAAELNYRHMHVMSAQFELIDGQGANAFWERGQESVDPEIARKLAMIRQDMGTFGVGFGLDAVRIYQPVDERIQFYM